MKKLLIALLLITCSSVASADNIPCPSSANYSFNGTLWKISLENAMPYNTCNLGTYLSGQKCEPLSNHHLYSHPYNPITKRMEQPAIAFDSIQFTESAAHINHNSSNEMTLQCEGTYSGEFFWFWSVKPLKGAMKAELLLPSTYKTCTSAPNGSSFDCSQ